VPLKWKLWLGRLFDWDKDGVRVVLFVIVFITSLLAVEMAYAHLTADECDELCRAEVDQYIERHAPTLGTPVPFDPDQFIRDALK
jgi:hypothetical protein